MNFKSTAAFFGLLLGMLWLFGLMLTYKKTKVEEGLLMPTLAAEPDVSVDTIRVQRGPEEYEFTLDKETWTLHQKGIKTAIRADTFQVKKIIDQVKGARKNDEAGATNEPARYELDPPKEVVVLTGKSKDGKEKTWKMFLGKESADRAFIYTNTSDRPGKVFAVSRSSVESMLFTNANRFRSTAPFTIRESEVQSLLLKQGPKEVEVKRNADGTWRFERPALGFATYENLPSGSKEAPPVKEPAGKEGELTVKSLLAAILSLRVDGEEDFVPLGDISPANFGVEEGKELLRIEIRPSSADKKEAARPETLLVGMQAKDKNQVFARLAGDEGVFKLNAKLLDPVEKALAEPGKLRSTDIAFFDVKKVDAVILKYGKDETKIWSGGGDKGLQMQTGAEKPAKASDKAVQSLLEALQGKREIQRFFDDADAKKADAELGFDAPSAEVTVYVDGLDKDAKEKEVKDKDGKDKKDDKKESKASEGPVFKKDVKPAVALIFGKTDKELVNVKRVLGDGTVSRFAVPKTILDKAAPPEGTLAFLDTALPNHQSDEIIALKLQRGSQKLEIVKGQGEQSQRWFFKETPPTTAPSQADLGKTSMLINTLATLQAKKWLRKIVPGEGVEKYGLANPTLTATLQIKKDRLQPASAASVALVLGSPVPWTGLLATAAALGNREADPGESVVLKIGQETDQEKDKPAHFAHHSGSDLLFLLSADLVRLLRETDLRDRTSILQAEAYLGVALWSLAAAEPLSGWLFASPLSSGQISTFDPTKVKEVQIALRTPFELRSFGFQLDAKEKAWQVKSGLQDFTLDAEKISQLLKDLGDMKTERFVSLDGQKPEHKLGPMDYQLKMDLTFEDGKTVTVAIGAAFERLGYFANVSSWPQAVFLLPAAKVEPLLHGPEHFAKERVVGGS